MLTLCPFFLSLAIVAWLCILITGTQSDPRYTRTVDIDFDIGSETIDYAKLAETEKLKPLELELRKLEDLVKDILDNMDHLQQREEGMRNTNGTVQITSFVRSVWSVGSSRLQWRDEMWPHEMIL